MIGTLNEPVAIVDLGTFPCPECMSENADFLTIRLNKMVVRGGTV